MTVEAQKLDQTPGPDLVFTKIDLQDVIPHENDPMVISMVTVGRKVHHVPVDLGSSAYVIFRSTFNKLQLSLDQLRPYDDYLYGFLGDQVEVRGHVELRPPSLTAQLPTLPTLGTLLLMLPQPITYFWAGLL